MKPIILALAFSLAVTPAIAVPNNWQTPVLITGTAVSAIIATLSAYGVGGYAVCDQPSCNANENFACCTSVISTLGAMNGVCKLSPMSAFGGLCIDKHPTCEGGVQYCASVDPGLNQTWHSARAAETVKKYDIPGGKDSYLASIYGIILGGATFLIGLGILGQMLYDACRNRQSSNQPVSAS